MKRAMLLTPRRPRRCGRKEFANAMTLESYDVSSGGVSADAQALTNFPIRLSRESDVGAHPRRCGRKEFMP